MALFNPRLSFAMPFTGATRVITGHFSEKEARGLASVLENPLQTPVSIEEERSVSPTLGADSIRASIIAGLVGLAITLVCVLVYYRFAGLIANLALIVNIVLLIGALTMFSFVLTLPGIAGIILTIGLAVDASVLIYERLREELALGKSLKVAVQAAYEKAFSSIFRRQRHYADHRGDFVLESKRPGQRIRHLAYARHSGLAFHRADRWAQYLRAGFVDTGRVKKVSMLHLISSQNINFLGKGFLACMCSLALVIAGATSFYLRGEKNFGVDFRGGDLITLSSPQAIDVGKVRAALATDQSGGCNNPGIEPGRKILHHRPHAVAHQRPVEKQIMTAMPEAQFKVEGAERVGALVGGELAHSSLVALGLGILGILIFVTFRFELSFAVARSSRCCTTS